MLPRVRRPRYRERHQRDHIPYRGAEQNPAEAGFASDQVAEGLQFRVLRVGVAQFLQPLVSDLGVPERLFDPREKGAFPP